jgi:hypothetical protein
MVKTLAVSECGDTVVKTPFSSEQDRVGTETESAVERGRRLQHENEQFLAAAAPVERTQSAFTSKTNEYPHHKITTSMQHKTEGLKKTSEQLKGTEGSQSDGTVAPRFKTKTGGSAATVADSHAVGPNSNPPETKGKGSESVAQLGAAGYKPKMSVAQSAKVGNASSLPQSSQTPCRCQSDNTVPFGGVQSDTQHVYSNCSITIIHRLNTRVVQVGESNTVTEVSNPGQESVEETRTASNSTSATASDATAHDDEVDAGVYEDAASGTPLQTASSHHPHTFSPLPCTEQLQLSRDEMPEDDDSHVYENVRISTAVSAAASFSNAPDSDVVSEQQQSMGNPCHNRKPVKDSEEKHEWL